MVYENLSFENESINFAKQALATFLNKPLHDISCHLLKGGSEEASIIQCIYSDKNYVVKLFSDIGSGKNEISWAKHADTLGIGSKLYYADPLGKFMIIEFVQGAPLTPATVNNSVIIKNIAHAVSILHNSLLPSAKNSDMLIRIDEKYKRLHCAGGLKELLEKCKTHVERIKAQLKSFPVELVSCHNDLNPGNIYINDNHVTLIDWGDSALSNPYYDIAAFLILNNIEQENADLFFEEYNANLLNPEFQEKFKLYRQLVYFEFALNLLLGVQGQNSALLNEHNIPDVESVTHYLTLLAARDIIIDSVFLYHMALASLNKMTTDCAN